MSNLPFFINKRKTTNDEQLEAAERLPEQRKLPSFNLDQPQEELSSQDRINLQKEKLKEAGKIISEPAEYDELDTSGYLPNQQMAGQGAWKTIRAALALQPREEEMPVVGKDPVTGKPIRFDPTSSAAMGIIKDPKIIGEIVGSLPTNVNKKQLLDALEFKLNDPTSDQFNAYDRLLDSSIRKYRGEKNLYRPEHGDSYSGLSSKDFQDELLMNLYPGIFDLEDLNKIKRVMNDENAVLPGSLGTAFHKKYNNLPDIEIPDKIAVKNLNDPVTLLHEAQHFEDTLTNPFKKIKNRQNSYTAKSFIKQLKDINPEINLLEKDVAGIPISDTLIKHGVNPYDFYNNNHFATPEYKTNYELEKALELLREEPRVLDSKGIQNNFDLLQALVKESEKRRFTPGKAKNFLNEQGFQSIDQLLKKKP